MQIRVATEADLPAIVYMGEKFHAFSADPVPYNRQSAEITARSLMTVGFIMIAEHGADVVGMIGVAVIPLFFNFDAKLAQELMWWVDKDARGSGAAIRLIRAAETEAKARGATRLIMARLANSPEHVHQLYDRLGYRAAESMHVKDF